MQNSSMIFGLVLVFCGFFLLLFVWGFLLFLGGFVCLFVFIFFTLTVCVGCCEMAWGVDPSLKPLTEMRGL